MLIYAKLHQRKPVISYPYPSLPQQRIFFESTIDMPTGVVLPDVKGMSPFLSRYTPIKV
jgi:hypothetical protein